MIFSRFYRSSHARGPISPDRLMYGVIDNFRLDRRLRCPFPPDEPVRDKLLFRCPFYTYLTLFPTQDQALLAELCRLLQVYHCQGRGLPSLQAGNCDSRQYSQIPAVSNRFSRSSTTPSALFAPRPGPIVGTVSAVSIYKSSQRVCTYTNLCSQRVATSLSTSTSR